MLLNGNYQCSLEVEIIHQTLAYFLLSVTLSKHFSLTMHSKSSFSFVWRCLNPLKQ